MKTPHLEIIYADAVADQVHKLLTLHHLVPLTTEQDSGECLSLVLLAPEDSNIDGLVRKLSYICHAVPRYQYLYYIQGDPEAIKAVVHIIEGQEWFCSPDGHGRYLRTPTYILSPRQIRAIRQAGFSCSLFYPQPAALTH